MGFLWLIALTLVGGLFSTYLLDRPFSSAHLIENPALLTILLAGPFFGGFLFRGRHRGRAALRSLFTFPAGMRRKERIHATTFFYMASRFAGCFTLVCALMGSISLLWLA